jgi:hypothetical protein
MPTQRADHRAAISARFVALARRAHAEHVRLARWRLLAARSWASAASSCRRRSAMHRVGERFVGRARLERVAAARAQRAAEARG